MFTLPTVDWSALKFAQPDYLWLLIAPALLFGIWGWQFVRRRVDVRRYLRHRAVPVRERFSIFGGLLFWFGLTAAATFVILALARPQVVTTRVRRAGIDLVVLQDGSTSMRVTDVTGDRWKRSMRFLKVLAETMRWDGDRIAMTSFARIATPQIRLTKDPNTFFFFIEHLTEPPFRVEDDASWDTNIEMGISWAMKLLDQDEKVTGRKSLFVNVAHTVRFKDMTDAESAPLLQYLFEHQVRPEFTCRFRWQVGSIAFWDNRSTMHNPVNDYHGYRRVMHRITLAGDRPRGVQ